MTSAGHKKIQEVLQTEYAWVEAHGQLDIVTIDHLMADDYTIIRPDGSVDGKAEAITSYRSATRHWDFAEGDEYTVRVYGNTALVTGRWTAKGVVNNGQAFDYQARFMSVYVKRNGQWQIVSEQSTPISA